MKKLITLLLVTLLSTSFAKEPAPDARPLRDALISFTWSWENFAQGPKSLEGIDFYRDGLALNPEYFSARWVITGSHTLTLQSTNVGRSNFTKFAYLVFNRDFTRYVGIDFNGSTNVEGVRREAVDPKRTLAEIKD